MPWGIAAAAVVGAGASVTGGLLQSGAAKDAAAAQEDAARLGIQTTQAAGRDALSYLDPYRNFGLTAGYAMSNMLYSPEQVRNTTDTQRVALQGEIDRLKAGIPQWETYQTFTGKNASERRRDAFIAERNTISQKIAEAEAKLATFNKQSELQLSQAQQAYQAQPLNQYEHKAIKPPTLEELEASPWYQFQSQLLGRTMDRHFAARGLSGSGFEAEEKRRGLIELGAGETERQYSRMVADDERMYNRMVGADERQFSRMAGMFGIGANAAAQGAGAITGTAQGVSNLQVGAGNAQAQGLIGAGNAYANMATGIGNAATGAIGAGLNYSMFNSLMSRNKPNTAGIDWQTTPTNPYEY
jgi:hypothetical protein